MLDKFWSCCWHVEVLAPSCSVMFLRRVILERHGTFSPLHTRDKFWSCCWHIEMLVLRPSVIFLSSVTLETHLFFFSTHSFMSYCLEAFSCSYAFTMLDKFWSCCWHVVVLPSPLASTIPEIFFSCSRSTLISDSCSPTLLSHLVALSCNSTLSLLMQILFCSTVDELPSPLASIFPEIFFSCSWSKWILDACSFFMVVHSLALACNLSFSFACFSVFDCSFSIFCRMFPVRSNLSFISVMFVLYSSCWILKTLFSSLVSLSSFRKVIFSVWNCFLSVINWELVSLILFFNNSSSFCKLDFSFEIMFMVFFSCCNSLFKFAVFFFSSCKSLVKVSVSMEQSDVPDFNRSVLVCG